MVTVSRIFVMILAVIARWGNEAAISSGLNKKLGMQCIAETEEYWHEQRERRRIGCGARAVPHA